MATLFLHKEDGATERIELTVLPFKVGKKAGVNHLVLGAQNISREHCVIFREGDRFIVQDMDSRNGTYIGNRRVVGREPLPERCVLRIGPYRLTFAASAAAADPAVAAAPPAAAAGGDSGREKRTPVELKRKIHHELLSTLDLKHTDFSEKSEAEIREAASRAAEAAVRKFSAERPSWLPARGLVKEVVDEAVGLGPIEDLLADDSVDEIMVNGWAKIYVEREGRLELTPKQFTDNDQVLAVIRRILAPIGRRVDESSPMVDARLADGSRVNAIISPLSLSGPAVTIRKFARDPFTAENLIAFGSVSPAMIDFLKLAVINRMNICISGGTGSGKTTLLNVLSGFIPARERIVTIEDAAELQLRQEHVVSLETKPPTIEGRGEVPIRKLVINALRMRPDRIVVGECRGGEALDMLQAMNTGHDGSLTTLHANSPRDALARLETMVLMAGIELPVRAIREQAASAIQLIVHGARLPDGSRRVTDISEITGMEGDIITMQTIFEFRQEGYTADGKVRGALCATGAVPKFVHRLRERGIEVDLSPYRTND